MELVERPMPVVGAHDVLIRVHHAGVCGTDLHIWEWDAWAAGRLRPPLIIGHEFAGEIVDLGSDARAEGFLAAGDLVTAEGHVICGHCLPCRTGNGHLCVRTSIIGVDRDGAFAEYIAMPASNVMKLDGIPTELGAIMDPIGNAVHTALEGGQVPACTALVIGCGPIGCFAAGVLRASGASLVLASDFNATRRKLAAGMGAHHVFDPATDDVVARSRELTGGLGVDLVCEMSGHPSGHAQAFAAARPGGRVNLLGTPSRTTEVDFARDIIFKGLTLYGVTGRKMYSTWIQMAHLLQSGQLDPRPVITHRFPAPSRSRGRDRCHQGWIGRESHSGDCLVSTDDTRNALERRLQDGLEQFRRDGVYKRFNYLDSPQSARVQMEGRGEVIILSSNDYLGLSDHPAVMAAGKEPGIDRFGAGTASVRFICGTFTIHRELEAACAGLVGLEASVSFVSCWNANEALPATVLTEQDLILSDQLNHASIIDGMRLAKAITKCETGVFPHGDYAELDRKLAAAPDRKVKMVVSDGIFSMEGSIVNLPALMAVCRKHGAILWIDDSHATGVLGPTGRGTPEHFGLHGQVDIITSTLGKALGGAAGGFVAGSSALCDYIMQRARPQLFTNALPPTVAASAMAAIQVLESEPQRVARLKENTAYFRRRLVELGFRPLPGDTPIVPVILGETAAAIRMSELLLDEGVFVTGFGYPVVPQGQARVRCQVSAAHSREDLDQALAAFAKVGRQLELI